MKPGGELEGGRDRAAARERARGRACLRLASPAPASIRVNSKAGKGVGVTSAGTSACVLRLAHLVRPVCPPAWLLDATQTSGGRGGARPASSCQTPLRVSWSQRRRHAETQRRRRRRRRRSRRTPRPLVFECQPSLITILLAPSPLTSRPPRSTPAFQSLIPSETPLPACLCLPCANRRLSLTARTCLPACTLTPRSFTLSTYQTGRDVPGADPTTTCLRSLSSRPHRCSSPLFDLTFFFFFRTSDYIRPRHGQRTHIHFCLLLCLVAFDRTTTAAPL